MKRKQMNAGWTWILVAMLGLACFAGTGCGSDNDSSSSGGTATGTSEGGTSEGGAPAGPAAADITGVWDTNMSRPEDNPPWSWDVDVTLTQTGQAVQGSFRAGSPQTLSGTYVNGILTATDSLGCLWQITFTESTGNGTRTRDDIPVQVLRMMR